MHRFHTIIPYSFFLVISNLPVSQSLGSWIYPSPTSSVFPVFNYIDTINTSWTTTIPEPHVLLIWCHPQESSKDYYRLGTPIPIPFLSKIDLQAKIIYLSYVVYNKTLPSGHNSQEVVFNFGDRAWELCHFDLASTFSSFGAMKSIGEYEYGFNGPNFRISKTDASEPITWREKVPVVESTSQIKAILTSGLAENKVSASDVFPDTQIIQVSSVFTPFTPSPSSSSSSSSAPPSRSLSPFASSLTSSAPLIPIESPILPPSSHTFSPTARALIGVGIVICLSLVLAIISMFSCNRKRQSHQPQQHQQQHQGLSGPPGGGKAQQQNNDKQKPKISKRHRYPLIELAGEEVANELEGSRPDCVREGKEREREILLHSPAICQMTSGMVRVYLYNLYTSLTLYPSG